MTILKQTNFDSDAINQLPPDWTIKSGTWSVKAVGAISGTKGLWGGATNDFVVFNKMAAQSYQKLIFLQKLANDGNSDNFYASVMRSSVDGNGGIMFLPKSAGSGKVITCRAYAVGNGSYSLLGELPVPGTWDIGDVLVTENIVAGDVYECRMYKQSGSRPSAATCTVTDENSPTGHFSFYRSLAGTVNPDMTVDDLLYENNVVAAVPDAPVIGAVTAGNASVVVNGTAPANNGSAITLYTATAYPSGLTGTGTTLPVTVSGLTNGVAQTVKLKAANGIGTGPESAASASFTPTAANNAPTFPGGSIASIAASTGVEINPVDVHALFADADALTYSASPIGAAWPSGLVINSATGIISGTPAAAATGIRVRATDTIGQTVDSNAFNVTVTALASFGVTNQNIYFSPGNWYSDGGGAMQANNVKAGSTFAWSNMRGSYLKFKVVVGINGSVALNINTATLAAINAAGCPQLSWSIDQAPFQKTTLMSGQTSLSLATGLSAGTHEVLVYFRGVYITQDGASAANYTTPNNRWQITSVVLSAGGYLSMPDIKPNIHYGFGDSITEGDLSNGGPRSAVSQDAFLTYTYLLAQALNAEVGIIGFYGETWAWFNSSWQNYANGYSRLVGGSFSPMPTTISINYGENDGNPGPAPATVAATLAAVSAAAPQADIMLMIPFSGKARTNLATAVLPNNVRRIDIAPAEMLPGRSATTWSDDGQHPNPRGGANLAARVAIQALAPGAPQLNQRTVAFQLEESGRNASNLTGLEVSFTENGVRRYYSSTQITDISGIVTFAFGSTLMPGQMGKLSVLMADGRHFHGNVPVS